MLRGVDLAELDATGRVLYAVGLALTSVASSATGLDKLDTVANLLDSKF